jgi:hypothetical protein
VVDRLVERDTTERTRDPRLRKIIALVCFEPASIITGDATAVDGGAVVGLL